MTHPSLVSLSLISMGRNPRTYFDPAEMAELEASVAAQGVIQPILVRPFGDAYQLVAGERRYRAAKKVKGDDYEIPVLVKDMTDAEADEVALIENVQRAQMSPTEEAVAAARVLGSCAGDHDEAAKRLGWSRATLIKRLALTNCSEAVRTALNERKIQLGHAELLAAAEKAVQDKALSAILEHNLTVAAVKQQLQSISKSMAAAIFDKSDCAGCQHNSDNQQALFGEAVSTGSCTNGACYTEKTEAELIKRKESLADEFPEVRIVRPGDQYTIIKLVAEGATGVGEEQAKACRACKNYGAAVSAIPDAMGKMYKNQCFDTACNSKMVAKRIAAEKAAEKAAAPATEKQPATAAQSSASTAKTTAAATTASTTKTTTAPTTVQDSNRVKEYRVKQWRTFTKKELMQNPEKNLLVMLSMAATGEFRHVSSGKLSEALGKMSGTKESFSCMGLTKAIDAAGTLSEEYRKMMTMGIAASAMDAIEERRLVEIMQFLELDLKNHWQLNSEFLDLLTKSEIEVLCEEIGLKAVLGKNFSKVLGQKKDDIIKALLKVEGFEYKGRVPRSMQYTK
ncbi:PRTRC system ParB family protein [Noviherbaspirillum sp. DKR-6]|uniref:PRTRC system ParB family protein n=2 Tax=Noviherbaspirillum pedocola TaxID=2801341 RepID=A0A934SYH1_9BURK|nr:PRTRC system ParB family protein [Noviherbaspirillum pedocola]